MENLEYRMYGMVPYNMSPIQQGIQFGHAVVDYGQSIKGLGLDEKIYNKWANYDKTFIVLNGGTTNKTEGRLGTLNQHLITLRDNGILVQHFCEPDFGDQLTAIVFLVDERVFNKILYPDFVPDLLPPKGFIENKADIDELESINKEKYDSWVNSIGGVKNAFLRDFLKPFKKA